MGLRNRTVYSYETRILALNREGTHAELRWRPDAIESIFNAIINMGKAERVEDKPGDWFFYLAGIKVDKNDNDPTHENCLCGWFESVRIGLRTDLMRRSTMATRLNPKEEDESEVRKTHFYFRLRDGLFLLNSYSDNIVTSKRVEAYIESKAKEILGSFGIRHITFPNLISKGFLEELDKFAMIRLAQIRLKIQPKVPYDTGDALGMLQEMSRPTYANFMDITIGRKNARKNGLITDHVKDFLRVLMRNREEVIAGTIHGSRSDGGASTLKLRGIEEKYKDKFESDGRGEVLSDPMFAYMIDIGNRHY